MADRAILKEVHSSLQELLRDHADNPAKAFLEVYTNTVKNSPQTLNDEEKQTWETLFQYLSQNCQGFPQSYTDTAAVESFLNVDTNSAQFYSGIEKARDAVAAEIQRLANKAEGGVAPDDETEEVIRLAVPRRSPPRSPTPASPDSEADWVTTSTSDASSSSVDAAASIVEGDEDEDEEFGVAVEHGERSALMARATGLNTASPAPAAPTADAASAGASSNASPVEGAKKLLLDEAKMEKGRIEAKISNDYQLGKGEIKDLRDQFNAKNKDKSLSSHIPGVKQLYQKFEMAVRELHNENQRLSGLIEAVEKPEITSMSEQKEQFEAIKAVILEKENAADAVRREIIDAITHAITHAITPKPTTEPEAKYKTYDDVYNAIKAILRSIADDATVLTDQTLAELDAIQKSLAPVFRSEFVENNANYDALKTSPEYVALRNLSTEVSTRIGIYKFNARIAQNIQDAKADIREILNVKKIKAKVEAAKNPKPAKPAKPGKVAPPKPDKPPKTQQLSTELQAAFKALEDENAVVEQIVNDRFKNPQGINPTLVQEYRGAVDGFYKALQLANQATPPVRVDVNTSTEIGNSSSQINGQLQELENTAKESKEKLEALLDINRGVLASMKKETEGKGYREKMVRESITTQVARSANTITAQLVDYDRKIGTLNDAMRSLISASNTATAKIRADLAARQDAPPPKPEKPKTRGAEDGLKPRSHLVVNAKGGAPAGHPAASALQATTATSKGESSELDPWAEKFARYNEKYTELVGTVDDNDPSLTEKFDRVRDFLQSADFIIKQNNLTPTLSATLTRIANDLDTLFTEIDNALRLKASTDRHGPLSLDPQPPLPPGENDDTDFDSEPGVDDPDFDTDDDSRLTSSTDEDDGASFTTDSESSGADSSSVADDEMAKPQVPIQTFFDVKDDKKLARSVYRQNIDALNAILLQDDKVITGFVDKIFRQTNTKDQQKVYAFENVLEGDAKNKLSTHQDKEFYFVVDIVAKNASETPAESKVINRDFLQDLRQQYIQAYTNNKSADNKQNTDSTKRYRDISKNDNPSVWTDSKEQARERTQAKHVYLANQLLAADSELPKDNFPVSMQTELVREKAAHVTLRKDYENKPNHDLVKVYGGAIENNNDLMDAFNALKIEVTSASGTYYLLATDTNKGANLDFYLREAGPGSKPEGKYVKGKDKMITTDDLKATWKYEPAAGTALGRDIHLSTFVQEQIVELTKGRGYTCTQDEVRSDAELAKEVAKRNPSP